MGKFEDDLKRVRLEEKPFDWFSFLENDANKAIRKFIQANKLKIVINWNARTYREFRRIFDFVNELVTIPDPQTTFYCVAPKFKVKEFKVYKRRFGFGHCKFYINLEWPFVIYYRRVADMLADEIKSSEFAKMEGAKHNEIYCKEYPFEKEYSFEFAQCGKTLKWVINNIYLNFIHDRFYAITQQMKNPTKSVEEFTEQN